MTSKPSTKSVSQSMQTAYHDSSKKPNGKGPGRDDNPTLFPMADMCEIETFFSALFIHADPASFVNIRAFSQSVANKPALFMHAYKVSDFRACFDSVAELIKRAASMDGVFSPPVCTFKDATNATTANVANGVALSVDLDEGDIIESLKRLVAILGQPTILMASGSVLARPNGDIQKKVHAHWRLTKPTRTMGEHLVLREARRLANLVTKGDASAVPLVHPLRWPGTWNVKNEPVMARIIHKDLSREIDLSEALDRLQAHTGETKQTTYSPTSSNSAGSPDQGPPNAQKLIDLLDRLPHGAEVERETYISVMRGVEGATRALERLGKITSEERAEIRHAAIQWAAKWEDPKGIGTCYAEEAKKFDSDFSRGTILAGWQTILNAGELLGLEGLRLESVRDTFAAYELEEPEEDTIDLLSLFSIDSLPTHPAKKSSRFKLITLEDLESRPPLKFQIDGYIQEKGLAFVFGAPKAYKTFMMLAMGLHVAAGRDWEGMKVKQGGVVYIAGEGLGGLSTRIKAMRRQFNLLDPMPFYVVESAVNFSKGPEVVELLAQIKEAVGDQTIGMVVLDTFARSIAGVDENSSTDVGLAIQNCDFIKDQLNCCVLALHHVKKGTTDLRGSSAIAGALDTGILVEKSAGGVVTMTVKYQKEAGEGEPMSFNMVHVPVEGTKGSLVPVRRVGAPETATPDLSPRQKFAFDQLKTLRRAGDKAWFEACKGGICKSTDPKAIRDGFNAVRKELIQKKVVRQDGEFYVPVVTYYADPSAAFPFEGLDESDDDGDPVLH